MVRRLQGTFEHSNHQTAHFERSNHQTITPTPTRPHAQEHGMPRPFVSWHVECAKLHTGARKQVVISSLLIVTACTRVSAAAGLRPRGAASKGVRHASVVCGLSAPGAAAATRRPWELESLERVLLI